MDVSTSGGVNCFRYFKRGLIKWYRFRFERKCLKITILFITSGDDRKWRTTPLTPLCTSTKWDLSSLKVWWLYLLSFLRKRVDMKNGNRPYLTTGSDFSKNKKTVFRLYHYNSTLKISKKSTETSLRNPPDKNGKIIIRIITRNSLRVMRRSSATLLQLRMSR